MGKSIALIWLASSYLFQGLNVLFFTLEDPLEDTEDRFDASITELSFEDLRVDPERVQRRFGRFKEKLRSSLRIVDGTDGGMSIQGIESCWERERSLGFDADVVIVDYDDEIRAVQKRPDRRFEFADIYRDYRTFLARRQLIGWIGAQANRQSEGKKIMMAQYISEDISKIRKATMSIGIGQSEWGEDARYLWVMAHRLDRQHLGCDIWAAPEKALFYDRSKTFKQLEGEKRYQNGTGNGLSS